MRLILVTILFFNFSVKLFCHVQDEHQRITREAFNLLKMSFPELQGSEMEQYLGTNETVNSFSSWKSWGAGKIVSGAWIEDEYDIVYHYGISRKPTFHQWDVDLYIDLFTGGMREAFTTITHFWDADGGINSDVFLHDYADGHYWSFHCENAMEKMYKYLNGDFNNRLFIAPKCLFSGCDPPYMAVMVDFSMAELIDLYFNNQRIKAFKYKSADNALWYPTNCPDFYSTYKQYLYEILGRMCHLLQDMSVPAHVHVNSHACTEGMYCDFYELNAEAMTQWTATSVYNNSGIFINPFNEWSDPIYYLMYFLNQITDHYASGLTNGDDNYNSSCPGLNDIIPNLGVPTTTNQINYNYCSQMHDELNPLAIRATAGLLYWFAVNTGQISTTFLVEPTSKKVVWSNGTTTYTLNNYGPNSMQWQLYDDADWVTISPTSGTLGIGQSQTLTAIYDQNNSNRRICNITINSNDKYRTVSLLQNEKPTLAGEISRDEIWSGNITLEGDVILPAEYSITIEPNTEIIFPDYKELYANGNIFAIGKNNEKIIFRSESQQYGNSKNSYLIKLNSTSSSASIFDNCVFKYAYRGIYINESSPEIYNCDFKYLYYGIYNNHAGGSFKLHNNNIDNCSYGIYNYYSDIDIRNNDIDYSSYGIYNYRSSPNIYSNDLGGGAFGIRCNSYSSPTMCGYSVPGYNHIHDNFMIGVYCEDNSNPFMGSAYCVMHGYNSLYDNEEGQVTAGSNCSVLAEENWWGRNNPPSGWFEGDVDYTPYLSSPPSESIKKSPEEEEFDIAFKNVSKNLEGGISLSFYDPSWNLRQKTRFIHALIYNGDPTSAQVLCKDIISNYPDSSRAFFALDLLWQASRQPNMSTGYNMTAFKDFLLTLATRPDKKILYGSATLLLAGFEKEQGLSRIDYVFNNYRNTYLAETALFQKFMFYLNDKEDIIAARTVLSDMDRLFPDSEYTLQAHHMLGDKVNWGKSSLAKSLGNEQTTEITNLPEKYELQGAFPNPFNPSTSIKYELPRLSNVNVFIYNILGQNVKNLEISSQNAGFQNITWNGTNNFGVKVPSGVYVIHFKAVSLEGKEEIYEKSLKVTLLK